MKLETKEINDILVIKISEKRLDAKEAVAFRDSINNFIQKNKYNLLLDFSDIVFIDSSGLGAIVSVFKSIGRNGKLVLAGINDNVMQTFTRTKMDKVFTICKNQEDAITSFA